MKASLGCIVSSRPASVKEWDLVLNNNNDNTNILFPKILLFIELRFYAFLLLLVGWLGFFAWFVLLCFMFICSAGIWKQDFTHAKHKSTAEPSH